MKPLKSLLPAVDDTATRALVDVQTAITKVKEIITYNVSHGADDKETTAQLNKAIAEECNRVSNVGLREQMRKSLVDAARAWHFLLKEQYRVLDNHLVKANQRQPLGIDINNLLAMTPYQREIEFAKILDDGTAPGIPIIRDYRNSVKAALRALAAEPPKVVTRKDGTTYVMPLRNRAEMAVRYDAHVKAVEDLQTGGVKFAWTSSHPNCSPRCKDFQGRLWSMFGDSGNLDGIPYQPINIALQGKNGDGNGIISGYNCRHRLIAYRKGSKPPQDFTEAEIKREYAIDKQQRSYENRIRQMKTEERELRAAGFTKEASALRKKWRRLTADYQIYSMEHGRAYFPDRYVIDRAELSEETYLSIDNSGESDILEPRYLDYDKGVFENKTVKSTFAQIDVSKSVDPRVTELYRSLSQIDGVSVTQSGRNGKQAGNKLVLSNPNTIGGVYTNIHELGHLIAYRYNPKGDIINDSVSQSDKKLTSAISTELTSNEELTKILSRVDFNPLANTLTKRLEYVKENPIQVIYDKRIEDAKVGFSGSRLDWLRLGEKIRNTVEKDYNEAVAKLWDNADDQANLILSDMLDAMTLGKALNAKLLPSGHGSYYANHYKVPEELFANYLTLNLMGARNQLSAFNSAFPATCNALSGTLEKAIAVKEERHGQSNA